MNSTILLSTFSPYKRLWTYDVVYVCVCVYQSKHTHVEGVFHTKAVYRVVFVCLSVSVLCGVCFRRCQRARHHHGATLLTRLRARVA